MPDNGSMDGLGLNSNVKVVRHFHDACATIVPVGMSW